MRFGAAGAADATAGSGVDTAAGAGTRVLADAVAGTGCGREARTVMAGAPRVAAAEGRGVVSSDARRFATKTTSAATSAPPIAAASASTFVRLERGRWSGGEAWVGGLRLKSTGKPRSLWSVCDTVGSVPVRAMM